MTTYFISDIHLHANAKENSKLLLDFLRHTAPYADAVYILGDLFAIWLGDDLALPYTWELTMTLRQLKNRHVPVYIMHGNRDFLLGKQFCADTGCIMLGDPCVINLYGQPVLLTHGDLLCTNDQSYQRYRRFVQNKWIQKFFLHLPRLWRIKLGRWVQHKASSKNRPVENADHLYDVNVNTVNEWFEKFNLPLMIHGHTHRPAKHQHQNNAQRFVLGDWTEQSAKILVATQDGLAFKDLREN